MMQRNDIEKCANEVLRQYNIDGASYSHIKEICEKEDIVVKRTAFGPNMDGAFSVIGNQKHIFYNSTMIPSRQNFTKAHELGHYFLKHPLENGNAIYCYNQNVSEDNKQNLPRIETEANYFASYFLMPKRLLLFEYSSIADVLNINPYCPLYVDSQSCNYRDWTIVSNSLTAIFGVSNEALRYRMETLGLLKFNL